ncbi:hypothetical protein C8R42DRAFT_717790 [Lentinula raphanica]|nr:hypothetical protein C8R42DRAFT_717790 [Lentinula raphanica]
MTRFTLRATILILAISFGVRAVPMPQSTEIHAPQYSNAPTGSPAVVMLEARGSRPRAGECQSENLPLIYNLGSKANTVIHQPVSLQTLPEQLIEEINDLILELDPNLRVDSVVPKSSAEIKSKIQSLPATLPKDADLETVATCQELIKKIKTLAVLAPDPVSRSLPPNFITYEECLTKVELTLVMVQNKIGQ